MSSIDPQLAPGDPNPPVSASATGVDEAQLRSELVGRAARYGMRTNATDWTKVSPIVARNQKATAALSPAVDGQPLRPIPPSHE